MLMRVVPRQTPIDCHRMRPAMKALRALLRLGLLIGSGIDFPGWPTSAQTTSPQGTQPAAPGLQKLAGDDERRVKQLNEQIVEAREGDRWEEAIAKAEEVFAHRTRVRGAEHFETVNAAWQLKTLRRLAALPKDVRAPFQA